MNRETQNAVLILLAIHVVSKLVEYAPLERARNKVNRVVDRATDAIKSAVRNDSLEHLKDLPGKQLTREALLVIAKHAGFPDPKLAAAIALAESGGVSNAIVRSSKEISVGLWQINTKVHPYTPDEMRNPLKNAAAAFKISKGGTDWAPWTTYTNSAYLKFRTGILE